MHVRVCRGAIALVLAVTFSGVGVPVAGNRVQVWVRVYARLEAFNRGADVRRRADQGSSGIAETRAGAPVVVVRVLYDAGGWHLGKLRA